MSVRACVFRNHRTFVSDSLAVGRDEITGESLFSDDRSFEASIAAHEFIGNLAQVAWLKTAMQNISATASESLTGTFLIDGSHCGDVIEKPQMQKIAKDTSLLLSQAKELDSEVIDFLNKVLRLCEAAEREDNPIVFV